MELNLPFRWRRSPLIYLVSYSVAFSVLLKVGTYLAISMQTELDYSGEEPSMSPRLPHQNHHPQSTMHGFPFSSGPSGASNPGSGFQTEHSDPQPKNYVFSNALSSPIRQSLQNYHISQGDYHPTSVQSSVNGFTNNEPNSVQHLNGDSNSFNSNDSSMDMRPDSPNQWAFLQKIPKVVFGLWTCGGRGKYKKENEVKELHLLLLLPFHLPFH